MSDVVRVTTQILRKMPKNVTVPSGDFWSLAYDPKVLRSLCWLRRELIRDCSSDARALLRAILLGALHGPRTKHVFSHLSNQCPRTYAPKPDYAVRFWRKHGMEPPAVDVLELLNSGQRFWNIMSVLLSPGRGSSLGTVLRFEGSAGPWPEVVG